MRVYKLSKLIFLVWLAMFGASAHAAIYGSSPCPYTAYSSPPSWGGTTLPLDGCTQAVLSQAMLPGLSFQDKTMFTDGTLFQSSSASFMGTIAGTGSGVLTVNAPVTGLILPNQFVYFPTVTPDTLFNNYGVAGGAGKGRAGTYTLTSFYGSSSTTATAMTVGQTVEPNLHVPGCTSPCVNWNVAGADYPTGITAGPNTGGAWCNGTYGVGTPTAPCSTMQIMSGAIIASSGSGCAANGTQTFTLSGGIPYYMGGAATVTGTVTGGSLTSGSSITPGSYADLNTPANAVTLIGDGCTTLPAITASWTTQNTPLINPRYYSWSTDPLNTGCKGATYATTGGTANNQYIVICKTPALTTNSCDGVNPNICIQGFDRAPNGRCVGSSCLKIPGPAQRRRDPCISGTIASRSMPTRTRIRAPYRRMA